MRATTVLAGLLFFGPIIWITSLALHEHYHGHRDHHDQCVVCKPSGKLAMWGECE